MYKVKRIQCVSCKKDVAVVLSSMEVLVVAKPNDFGTSRHLNKNIDIIDDDTNDIRDFDDYIIVTCVDDHKNRVFLKKT